MLHYSSPDLWQWKFHGPLALSSDRVIDACVERLAPNRWRMWYKDEDNHSHTFAADSPDLMRWTVAGEVMGGAGARRAPTCSAGAALWWMITDHWDGFGVSRSDDALAWTRQPKNILREAGKASRRRGQRRSRRYPGARRRCLGILLHAPRPHSPARRRLPRRVQRGALPITPHLHPGVQTGVEGTGIVCRRDEPCPFRLQPGIDNWTR